MPVSNSRVRRIKERKKGGIIDWPVIKEAYCYRPDAPSFRQMGKEFNVTYGWICQKAQREGWQKLREAHWAKVTEKVKDKFLDKGVDERTQQVTVLQTVIDKYIADLSQGRIKVTTNEIVNVMKHMILLMGGVTERMEHQGVNFTQAVNILNQSKGIDQSTEPAIDRVKELAEHMEELTQLEAELKKEDKPETQVELIKEPSPEEIKAEQAAELIVNDLQETKNSNEKSTEII